MRRKRRASPQATALLAALLARPRVWTYGYELSRQTGLSSGTLYPLLLRLSDRGLLEDGWEDSPEPGKPRRHVYRLTATGATLARELTRATLRVAGRAGPNEVPA